MQRDGKRILCAPCYYRHLAGLIVKARIGLLRE
jgi:hypothetical protein